MDIFHGTTMPDDRLTVPSLGADVRAIRKARKMTLIDLSDAMGRSVGWLSQVERDKSYPTIADLNKMAALLDVSVSSFLQVGTMPGEEGVIVRSHARRPIGSRTPGLTEALLSPDLTDDFEVIHSTFAPNSYLPEPLTRPTQEVCYILSGSFEIALNGKRFLLEQGDSFRLRGEEFQWWNRGDTPCEIVWVISPPIY
ncbi:helix-turn-helix domain-containing protein [Roseobacter sp. CCS2]|uniref:helix-turn-helix domain-containing protein n=1 Tax=Roseobacter sp. CCS2 TaxID=391593 RepID=UPI0000F4016D|nr:XRE family transcriptional regulator [Roseobacter sp. CCS2]EBA13562.1 DNA-binding protein [Roseobacter sp. CCS2]